MAYMKVDSTKLDSEMTSLADKLREKGGTEAQMEWPDGFEEAVDNLNTFTPPSSMALDPDEVYRTTRPKDWLPMPTPGDDEVYLLNLIPEGLDGAFTAQINFTGTCAVEFGNLVDGVFVAKETVTPTSGTRFYYTVLWDDYEDDTSDGYRQYLVRIKGGINIVFLSPDSATTYSYGVPMLVDAVIGVDTVITFASGDTVHYCCDNLRYVRFVGNGDINYGGTVFRGCERLMSVSIEKKSIADNFNYMFPKCRALIAISENLFNKPASCNYTFSDMAIRCLPKVKISATKAIYAFSMARNLLEVDGSYFDTSQCTDFSGMFYNSAIRIIKDINISSATNFSGTFDLSRIMKLTFAGETTPGGWTIDCKHCIMSHKALVNMINSLPTALSPATITITNNPGASALTDEEIAVATAKNWTVTI